MRRNFPEVIADFEAYLLRLISSPPLMRLAACGGYCALPHTCIHSQKQHSLPSSPPPCPPCKETQPGWKRSLEFLAGKLLSAASEQLPLLSAVSFPWGGQGVLSFITSWIPSGTFIWGSDWGLAECQAALPLSSCIPYV